MLQDATDPHGAWQIQIFFVRGRRRGVCAFSKTISKTDGGAKSLGPIAASGSTDDQAGRGAASPEDIPAQGWWQIVKRTAKKFSHNELMSEAASVTFFACCPSFQRLPPSSRSTAYPATIGEHLGSAAGIIPSGGVEIVREQVKRLTASPASGLSVGAIFGVLTALWSANQGSKAMFSALNDVYGEREERRFLRKTATSLAFTIGGVACLLGAVGAIVVMPIVFKQLGLESAFDLSAKIARWPILLASLVVARARARRNHRLHDLHLAIEHGAFAWCADQCRDGNPDRPRRGADMLSDRGAAAADAVA